MREAVHLPRIWVTNATGDYSIRWAKCICYPRSKAVELLEVALENLTRIFTSSKLLETFADNSCKQSRRQSHRWPRCQSHEQIQTRHVSMLSNVLVPTQTCLPSFCCPLMDLSSSEHSQDWKSRDFHSGGGMEGRGYSCQNQVCGHGIVRSTKSKTWWLFKNLTDLHDVPFLAPNLRPRYARKRAFDADILLYSASAADSSFPNQNQYHRIAARKSTSGC